MLSRVPRPSLRKDGHVAIVERWIRKNCTNDNIMAAINAQARFTLARHCQMQSFEQGSLRMIL